MVVRANDEDFGPGFESFIEMVVDQVLKRALIPSRNRVVVRHTVQTRWGYSSVAGSTHTIPDPTGWKPAVHAMMRGLVAAF